VKGVRPPASVQAQDKPPLQVLFNPFCRDFVELADLFTSIDTFFVLVLS
jgi:hypothetical protein